MLQVFADPPVRPLGRQVRLGCAGARDARTVGRPATLDDLPVLGPVPDLGEHTDEVLRGIDMTDEELVALRSVDRRSHADG